MKSFDIESVVFEVIYPGEPFLGTIAGNEPREIQLKIEDLRDYHENFINMDLRKTWHLEYDSILWFIKFGWPLLVGRENL